MRSGFENAIASTALTWKRGGCGGQARYYDYLFVLGAPLRHVTRFENAHMMNKGWQKYLSLHKNKLQISTDAWPVSIRRTNIFACVVDTFVLLKRHVHDSKMYGAVGNNT